MAIRAIRTAGNQYKGTNSSARTSSKASTKSSVKLSSKTSTGNNAKTSSKTSTGNNVKTSGKTSTGNNVKTSGKTSTGNNAKTSSKTSAKNSTKTNNNASGAKNSAGTVYLKDAPKIYTSFGKAVSYNRPAESYTSQKTASTGKKSGSTTNPGSSITYGRPEASYVSQKKSGTSAPKSNDKNSKNSKNGSTSKTAGNTKTAGNSKATSVSMTYGRPEASYTSQKKTNNSKTVKSQTKSVSSSITYGRPKESYTVQEKTKTTKKLTLQPTQIPVKKVSVKKQSSTIKNYKPSDSRNGAGVPFYSKKTNPTGAKEGASFLTSLIPGVGDAKDVQEALTGTDLITGNKLTGTERVITAGAIFIPVVSGKSINSTGKVVKAATKEPAQKAIKSGARKLGKKTDEFVDGAKKAGDKIVKGLDDAGEKINKSVKKNVKIETNDIGKKASKGGRASGKFKIDDWTGYPDGLPKPEGPFRVLEGDEYNAVRDLANKTNTNIHKNRPDLKGTQIHEVHPVKFGGSPTDIDNKIALSPKEHAKYTTFWNKKLREIKGGGK